MDNAKAKIMDSCIVQLAPKMKGIFMDLKDIIEKKKPAEKGDKAAAEGKQAEDKVPCPQEAEDKGTEKTEDVVPDYIVKDSNAAQLFTSLQQRLAWHNTLGLAASEEESRNQWLTMKGLEIDFGPRNRGRKVQERIEANLRNNFHMYMHILLLLMALRAFLFRSYFACLPWLCAYQFISLMLPLDGLAKLPQVPLEKVPVEGRVLATVSFNALIWFFFNYEVIWRTWFFEKVPLVGLIIYHAYAARPVGA